MIALIAGLVLLLSVAFGILGLVVYVAGVRVPWWGLPVLWGLPFVPFVALASLVVMVVSLPRG